MRSILMAFSLFSRIPVPGLPWNEKNQKYLMAAFPWVGLCLGLTLWLWQMLCYRLNFSAFLWGVGLALLPLWFTGGIHMDGFADTVDALSSHASPEEKARILKDPHAGAFAVSAVCCYCLAYAALAAQLPIEPVVALRLALVHGLSRTGSGLCSLLFPSAGQKGMLSGFRRSAQKRGSLVLLALWLVLLSVLCLWTLGGAGLALPLLCAACAWRLWRLVNREFTGVSGDLCGYYLQLAELAMVTALAIIEGSGIG